MPSRRTLFVSAVNWQSRGARHAETFVHSTRPGLSLSYF